MKHANPKPFVEKELRLSGKFSFEMVKSTNNLYSPLKKKLLRNILMITIITYLRMVLHFVSEAKETQFCSN